MPISATVIPELAYRSQINPMNVVRSYPGDAGHKRFGSSGGTSDFICPAIAKQVNTHGVRSQIRHTKVGDSRSLRFHERDAPVEDIGVYPPAVIAQQPDRQSAVAVGA